MSSQAPFGFAAGCKVTTNALAGNPSGVSAVVHTGTGDYLVTLSNGGVDAADRVSIATCRTGGKIASCVETDDTHVQVLTTDAAAAAADVDFNLAVFRTGVGT